MGTRHGLPNSMTVFYDDVTKREDELREAGLPADPWLAAHRENLRQAAIKRARRPMHIGPDPSTRLRAAIAALSEDRARLAKRTRAGDRWLRKALAFYADCMRVALTQAEEARACARRLEESHFILARKAHSNSNADAEAAHTKLVGQFGTAVEERDIAHKEAWAAVEARDAANEERDIAHEEREAATDEARLWRRVAMFAMYIAVASMIFAIWNVFGGAL